MPELSRRGFLRGLVAAAVATQLPNLAPADREALTETATVSLDNLRVSGDVVNAGIQDMGDGWFRVWKTFTLDYTRPLEMFVTVDAHDDDADANLSIGKFETNVIGEREYTASCYIKQATEDDESAVYAWGGQVTEGQPPYINTS